MIYNNDSLKDLEMHWVVCNAIRFRKNSKVHGHSFNILVAIIHYSEQTAKSAKN